MNARTASTIRTALAAAVIMAPAMAAVPAAAAAPQAKPGKAVVLEYKMPAGRSLTYQYKQDRAQAMEVQGQSMDSQVSNACTATFRSKGPKDNNLVLGVTIDDIQITVANSMTGDMSPDMAGIKGRSFDMVLSPLGSEMDVSGAQAITYAAATETSNIAYLFKAFFPDLPAKAVKIGDTWPSSDSVDMGSSSMGMRSDNQYVHTLEGFETVDGLECARISAQVTGTISGTGNQGGMDLTMSGTSKGKVVWYFAVKEGIFVKAVNDTTAEVSVDASAAGMTIPVTETIKTEIKLAGKS